MKKILLLLFIFKSFLSFSQPGCGGLFIDSGGVNGSYQNNSNYTTTICPNVAGEILSLTFTSFSLEISDHLIIYDGVSAVSSAIIADLSGSISLPYSVSANSNNNGCLTIVFTSDSSGVSDGWIADVNCIPIPCETYANSAELTFCDPNELPIFNLDDATPQIIGSQTNVAITYHETLSDAEIGLNPIFSSYAPTVQYQQTLYSRVTNFVNGCYAVSTLLLHINDCNFECLPPINLTASNSTETSFQLNWQNDLSGNPSSVFYSICVVPYGQQATNNGSITVSSNQSSYDITNLENNTCYSVYIKNNCDVGFASLWSEPLNYCTNDCDQNGSCSDSLILITFLDSNNNGIKDANESTFTNGNLTYQINNFVNATFYGNSNNGYYHMFDSSGLTLYDFQFLPYDDYYSCTTTYNDINIAQGSGVNYLYFPVILNQSFVDAHVNINNYNNVIPGFNHYISIFYGNNSPNIIPSGSILYTKDEALNINSISQSGVTMTPTGFTFDFFNLLPYENRNISIEFAVPTIPTVNLGQLVTNSVIIDIVGDYDLSNNSSTFNQTIVGSYDPNDIIESHGEKIVHSTFTGNDYLYYTIRFENTGTANAQFIKVENELDPKLDENTFELINSSHNVNITRNESNLKFNFYSINLPPTAQQPEDSHGYIVYKIKPKPGYAIGDIIPNTANIYFDFNPAIITNTFNTEFVAALANTTFEETDFVMYPNPATNLVTINLINNAEKINSIVIYDVLGKKVKSINSISSSNLNIDVSDLSKGIYIVKLKTDSNLELIKKLVIK